VPTYERGDVSIYYEEHGSNRAFPLFLLAPGGLNSTIDFWGRMPFSPMSFDDEFRVIAMDQRNAGSRSRGPLPVDDPWGGYAADQLGLMDHLGIDRFLAIGCCIGCSFILKLAQLAPERVVAGVLEQPIGLDETNPGVFGPRMYNEWGKTLSERRPDISMDDVGTFGTRLFEDDFIFSVPRGEIGSIQNPMLVLPGSDAAHPTQVGLEVGRLLPNAELVGAEWKTPEAVPQTVTRIREFLRAHTPTGVA